MVRKLEGRAKRLENRTKIPKNIYKAVEKLIGSSGLFPPNEGETALAQGISEEKAIEIQQQIKAGIEYSYKRWREKKRFAYLAHGLIWTELMAQAGLNVPPELPAIEMATPNSLFTPEWMVRARVVKLWRDTLNLRIARLEETETIGNLIDLTVASAICHGLLVNPSHVLALAEALSRKEARLRPGPFNSVILEFEDQPTGGLVHSQGPAGASAMVTFVPDAISLGLICKCLDTQPGDMIRQDKVLAPKQTRRALLKRLKRAVFGTSQACEEIGHLTHLCETGFWPSITEGADLSYAILAAMTGKTPTTGPAHLARPKSSTPSPIRLGRTFDLGANLSTQKSEEGLRVADADQEVLELEEIIALSTSFSGKRDTQHRLAERLKASCMEPTTGSIARLLKDYLFHLIVTQKRKASTFRTYASRLLHPLALAFGDLDIRELSAEVIEDLYRIALDQKLTTTSRAYCARVMAAMHGFAMRHPDYGLPALSDSLSEGTGKFTIVRAHIPSLNLVKQTIEVLETAGEQGKMLAALVLVAFRSGLRIGEICKLRSRDIQVYERSFRDKSDAPRPVIWIWVRQSKYGDNKTENARRKIPLSALMTDRELEGFKIFLNRHFASAVDESNELLFSDPISGQQLDRLKTSAAIAKVMREIDPGPLWNFHSLRHGALNAVHAALEGQDDICAELFGWRPETCQRVRSAIVGDKVGDVRSYHALAKFAGHATAAQTWASYLHLLPWIVAAKRDAARSRIPLATLAGATGITQRTLREQCVSTPQSVARLMGPRLKKLLQIKEIGSAVSPKVKRLASVDQSISMSLTEGALNFYGAGGSVAEIAKHFGLDQHFVRQLIASAQSIMTQAGARGQKRLSSKAQPLIQVTEKSEHHLIPPAPRTKQAHQLARQLFDHFIAGGSNRDSLFDLLNPILAGINAQDAEIRFYEPAELKAVVTKVATFMPASLWNVEVRRRPGRVHALALRRWRAALGPDASISETLLPASTNGAAETKAGTALVRIYLPYDPMEGPARATAALKYAAALALIAINARTNLEAW